MLAARRLTTVLRSTRTPAVRCLSASSRLARPSPSWTLSSTKLQWQQNGVRIMSNSRWMSSSSLPAHETLKLPALSPTMELGTIVSWEKKEGDVVEEGDVLARVETDKAVMEWEATISGTLAKILVPEGSKDVKLGAPVCLLVGEGADIGAFSNYAPQAGASEPAQPAASNEEPAAEQAPASNLPTHDTLKLPALSPTMELGTIVSWEVNEGDVVAEGDVLARVETDKAVMEWESTVSGTLAKIIVPAGTKDVKLGAPVCVLVDEGADIGAFSNYTPQAAAAKPAVSAKEPAVQKSSPAPSMPSTPVPVQSKPVSSGGRIFASPLARMSAAQQGIDLATVRGSGPNGRIRQRDLAGATSGAAQPAAISSAEYADLPLSNMRKVIARRLVESKQTIPHYYLSVDAHVDRLLEARAELNSALAGKAKLSVNDFVIKAAALAMQSVPEVNSSWQETFIRQYNNVDINVAVATPNGLITPIVFDADRKGLVAINGDVMSLAEKAKNNLLKPHEFQGGTFTISNLGMYGIKNFTAIINPPQACILAVGGTEKRLVPDESSSNGYRTASVMTVTLSCDHRVVDGAVGAQWLAAFRKNLEHPAAMLL